MIKNTHFSPSLSRNTLENKPNQDVDQPNQDAMINYVLGKKFNETMTQHIMKYIFKMTERFHRNLKTR